MKKLLTVGEVAELLRVDPATVRVWLNDNKLKGVKLAGGVWRISEASLLEFLSEEREEGDHDGG